MNYLTYTYLLTPLHTGASAQAGNLMGIARESFNELPYIPSSSLRGKIRAVLATIRTPLKLELFSVKKSKMVVNQLRAKSGLRMLRCCYFL